MHRDGIEIVLRAQNTNNIIDPIVNTNCEVLCDQLKRKKIFTLTSYNIIISTPIPKREMIVL